MSSMEKAFSDPQALERVLRDLLERKEPLWSSTEAEALMRKLRGQTNVAVDRPPARWQDPIIEDAISSHASVLDLGCGSGDLLLKLMREKHIQAQGVELDPGAVQTCIEHGVPVLQCDLDAGLRGFATDSFDTVVLEETLQTLRRPMEILGEMLRVGQHGIVSFPNFGVWKVRLYLALEGRMPVTERLPYGWHNTPNIHLFTIRDFLEWVQKSGVRITQAFSLRGKRVSSLQPDDILHADEALFFLTRGKGAAS